MSGTPGGRRFLDFLLERVSRCQHKLAGAATHGYSDRENNLVTVRTSVNMMLWLTVPTPLSSLSHISSRSSVHEVEGFYSTLVSVLAHSQDSELCM